MESVEVEFFLPTRNMFFAIVQPKDKKKQKDNAHCTHSIKRNVNRTEFINAASLKVKVNILHLPP